MQRRKCWQPSEHFWCRDWSSKDCENMDRRSIWRSQCFEGLGRRWCLPSRWERPDGWWMFFLNLGRSAQTRWWSRAALWPLELWRQNNSQRKSRRVWVGSNPSKNRPGSNFPCCNLKVTFHPTKCSEQNWSSLWGRIVMAAKFNRSWKEKLQWTHPKCVSSNSWLKTSPTVL